MNRSLLLEQIISDPSLHARWLNTLSLMENTGARKIKKAEHPIFVSEEILKHAAEEVRHAWYLKKQIAKTGITCPNYEAQYLLAPKQTVHYLQQLDIAVCRYLKQTMQLKSEKLKLAAFLLVTYAIEVRADELYPCYQQLLKKKGSKISVQPIINDEKGHLAEMEKQLQLFSPHWKMLCAAACCAEAKLYQNWMKAIVLDTAGGVR
jgi:bacterioferritin (cytochrome b1)